MFKLNYVKGITPKVTHFENFLLLKAISQCKCTLIKRSIVVPSQLKPITLSMSREVHS